MSESNPLKKSLKVARNILFGIVGAFLVLFFGVAIFGQSSKTVLQQKPYDFPPEMWNAVLVIRPGISDFKGAKMSDIFRDVKFKEYKQPDGTFNTFHIVPERQDGNDYSLRWEVLKNGKPDKSTVFRFLFKLDGKQALLYEIYIESKDVSARSFNDIVYMMGIYGSQVEKWKF